MVTAEPDDRPSTAALLRIVQELDRRAEVEVTTFFLRTSAALADDWGRFRIVDDLRTHPVSRALSMFGARPSGWFKGRMLRRWLAEVDPDVVLLDDGLGERVVQSVSPRPFVVVRPNAERPITADLEPPALRDADLVLRATSEDAESTQSLESGHVVHAQRLARLATAAQTAERERWSVPDDEFVLVGWGPDPWLDGTNLFIRTLWYLQHRHETAAHGVWLGLSPDSGAVAELQMEVERCGLAGRMHFRGNDDETNRLVGDAVLLPHRTVSDLGQVLEAIASGAPVVGFAPAVLEDPSFLTVSPLDLDGAARMLAVALREDPQRRLDRSKRLDVARWASSFIDAIDTSDDREVREG